MWYHQTEQPQLPETICGGDGVVETETSEVVQFYNEKKTPGGNRT